MATRPVLRIFLSSTAVDLRCYRDKVRDAILRLENLPIAMETFSARSGQPAAECRKMAAEADAVICVVGHRYGYVPPPELGGDGDRSITWLEVEAAKRAGKPVFAFLVDPNTQWAALKEQDRLVSDPERTQEIVKAVQKLQEFKAYLGRERMWQTFTGPDDLAMKVAISLANFAPHRIDGFASTARVWQPLFCHALQPAQHFRGRKGKIEELEKWLTSPATPDRVVSVVAPGGTGKTALVDKALRKAKLSDRAGVFVWSFYEDPHTDAFLRAAYLYFTGTNNAPAGGMLERLQMALSGDAPHVLVLDGLERVQSEGDHGPRGELEDLQLKRLLRGLAGSGNIRALVTSRFPLVDLDPWTGVGYRTMMLDDLERAVAFDVLRAWSVKGNDKELAQLLEPLSINGFYHALSITVLGSYIGNFADGDPSRVPDFSLEDARESDPKARRLIHVLEQYAKALTATERDLLGRVSLFPQGIGVEFLFWIVQSGGEVAGALVGLTKQQLVKHLERLKILGLVFSYQTERQTAYSAHPFLRDFFRNSLGIKSEPVHESVRAKLAASLKARPKTGMMDPAILDHYELLIEQTLLAGRFKEAYKLFFRGLGGYENLGLKLGENGRGLRILRRFFPRDDLSQFEAQLTWYHRGNLIHALGSFARDVGDLARARQAFSYCRRLAQDSYPIFVSDSDKELAWVEISAGRFRQALEHSESAFAVAARVWRGVTVITNSLICRATSRFALGDISGAKADFQKTWETNPPIIEKGILEAECKFLRGDRSGAHAQIQAIRELAVRKGNNSHVCRCNALLVRLLLPDDLEAASRYLQEARIFANCSGVVDHQLRCFHAACELSLQLEDYSQVIIEAEAGIILADTCGFGKFSIDLRLALAEAFLKSGAAHKSLQNARNAFDRSEQPDCQYAWGKADGLHFCGLAHLRLSERELARQRLTAALDIREHLGHGRIEETRCALELCGQ